MIGCLECPTYWSGYRARLEQDSVDAISYSTGNCGVAVAGLKVYVS